MTRILYLGMLLLAPAYFLGSAATAPSTSLKIDVTDLRNHQGNLRVGVFQSDDGFPEKREGAMLWKSLAADVDPPTLSLDLPPGRYAVVVLHDENDNKKLDRNFLGIPKEGYGVTNNPKPRLRAATFQEAIFDLPADGKSVQISIQYF